MFHRDFKHEKTDESTRPQAECFYCFRVFEPRWNTKHSFLKSLLQQNKISLNYHLNKLFQLKYCLWWPECEFVTYLLMILNFFCICFSYCYPLVVLWVSSKHVAFEDGRISFARTENLFRRGRVFPKCSSLVDAIHKQFFWGVGRSSIFESSNFGTRWCF